MTSSVDDAILLDVFDNHNSLEDVNRAVVPITASATLSSYAERTRDTDHFFHPLVASVGGRGLRKCREWYYQIHLS